MKMVGLAHRKWLLTVLFAVSVFCFWAYIRPYQIVERESLQLFLWNNDYLFSRLAVPGGLARYLGEFLVQFFKLISLGSVVSALLLAGIQWLTWVLLSRCFSGDDASSSTSTVLFLISFLPSIALCYALCDMDIQMTLPVAVFLVLLFLVLLPQRKVSSLICSIPSVPIAYWLAGPVAALVPLYHLRWLRKKESGGKGRTIVETIALLLLYITTILACARFTPYPTRFLVYGIDYQLYQKDKTGSVEEMEYDYLQRLGNWDGIIRKSNGQQPQNLACQNVVRLARWYRQQISEEELKECLRHTDRVLVSSTAALMMSDVYLQLGMVNMSQRTSFEVMEGAANYNKSARALARLTEIAVITGQKEVALKYLSLLEQTVFYRSFAQQMRELLDHPERLKNDPHYGGLQKVYGLTEDVFFI